MIAHTHTITNRLGLHARASAKLVELAGRYQSEIYISCNEQKADAKSILAVMLLGAKQHTVCLCECHGDDEQEAATAIQALFEAGFGDPA